MDTLLYDTSIPYISSLQDKFSEQANLMQLISVIFDPKYAFLIYSPVAYLLDHKVGKKLILTTVITEWLNMILKWFLHGERPYWYVHSSGHFNTDEINIKQFPITCELGPGHPSGHAMVTAAVWFIILDSVKQLYDKFYNNQHSIVLLSNQNNPQSSELQLAAINSTPQSSNIFAGLSIWTLYGILLLVVSVSRVFLGCHFPHQCLAGALLGFFISKLISKYETKALHFMISSMVLFMTAFGTFFLLQALGMDPAWTIKLATKHCIKREYIHLDTAPFFSIMRYCGFSLGTGLALLLPPLKYHYYDKSPFSSKNLGWFSARLLMALMMARLVDNLGLFVSHSNMTLFYSSAFLAYTGFSFAFINL